MIQKSGPQTSAAEKTIKDIRRATRKHSSEGKIRIVLEGLRGEDSIAAIVVNSIFVSMRYNKSPIIRIIYSIN